MNDPALIPGSSVIVQGTLTGGPIVWTKSGLPGQPISISSEAAYTGWGFANPGPGAALTFSGVHDVVLASTNVTGGNGVAVTGSQNVTIEDSRISGVNEGVWIQDSTGTTVTGNIVDGSAYVQGVPQTTGDGIVVTGTSSGTMINRDEVQDTAGTGSAIVLKGGSQGTIVARNTVQGESSGWPGSDLLVQGSTGDTVVSNTFKYGKQSLTAANGSTGLTIADNIFYDEKVVTQNPAIVPMVSIDQSSTSGTTLNHDIVYRALEDFVPQVPPTGQAGNTLLAPQVGVGPAYSWGGTTYQDAAALHLNTGQGTSELTADPQLEPYSFVPAATSPAIDSADSGAPDWQSVDLNGGSPFHDPYVQTTGWGIPAYADRGAVEFAGGPQVAVAVTPLTRADAATGQTQYGFHLDLSGSVSKFAPIKSYGFLANPGEVTGTPNGATVDYWYCDGCAGSRYVDVSVTDTAGHVDSKRLWLTVPESTPPSGGGGGGTPPPPPGGGGGGGGGGTTPTSPTVHRIPGTDRYQTSQLVSQAQWQSGSASAVVLARGDQAPDALAGVPLAAHVHGPLLLTNPEVLDSGTRAEIDRVTGGPRSHKTIYILGGDKAVSPSIQSSLQAAGYNVVRYQGDTRYGTALAVAGAFGPTAHVLVATGQNFPDALAAGPLGAVENAPIVLSDDNKLDAATAAFVLAHRDIDPVGGFAQRAVAGLNLAGKTVDTTLSGATRYETAAAVAGAVAKTTGHAPTAVGIASGATFPDALTGGAYAANAGIPLLITAPDALPGPIQARLAGWANGLTALTVFGGTAAVSDSVFSSIVSTVRGRAV